MNGFEATIQDGGMPMSVSAMVREDYRAADVFKKWGINYCCGGDHTLEQACASRGLDRNLVESDLEASRRSYRLPRSVKFHEWPVGFLVDYIVNVHHAYIKQALPALTAQLAGFASGHKAKYPHLQNVATIFQALGEELEEQLENEESSVFPYVKQVSNTCERREVYGSLFVKTMGKPLARLDNDHNRLYALLLELRESTGDYSFENGVCTNYQVVFHKLREFDEDLVQHRHLENSILFPAVLHMEKQLLLC